MLRTSLRLLLLPLSAVALRGELRLLSGVTIPGGGEVVAHHRSAAGPDHVVTTNSLARTAGVSHRADIFTLDAGGQLAPLASANFDPLFGATATLSVSSVAADPLGRGFAAASVIPSDNTRRLGKVAFFALTTGQILASVEVGFHPDAVKFTPDGSKLIVANEGEYAANGAQAPGSVSVVNLAGITGPASFATLTPSVATIDFQAGLAPGVTLDQLRINVANVPASERYRYVEPEFSATTNDRAYVTLQENNAIAIIDLTGPKANLVTAILPLGTITQRIDASDRDATAGGITGIAINDLVAGLPMPDTIATFVHEGRRLLATANEGDARTDDGDIARASTAGLVDTVAGDAADRIFAGSLSESVGIGRLNLSRFDGDTDGDGLIEVPTMIGTRSFSLWDESGRRVFDSGSMIEEFVRTNATLTFNMNNGSTAQIDTRSDDKGPEPEALAHGEIDGRHFIFVGAERQNGIFQFDVTDLTNVRIVGYYNAIDGVAATTSARYVSPETLVFVPASSNASGRPLLLVGYEGVEGSIDGSVAVLEVTASSASLGNLSIQTQASAAETQVVGFQVSGAETVLLRAVGPGLAGFGVTGFTEDPRLALYAGPTLLDANDDWAGSPALGALSASVGAFPLAPGSRDAVLARAVSGTHTLHLGARSAGTALVELYGTGPGARFRNVSVLGRVGDNDPALIAGFVVRGTGTRDVLVRAVGPALARFGVTGAAANPSLLVHRGSLRVGENDDWSQGGATAADFAAAGAFPLEGDTRSAAVRLTLTAGSAYTVHVTSAGPTASTVLLEVYELP